MSRLYDEELRGLGLRTTQCSPSGRLMAETDWFLIGTQDAHTCVALARAKQFVPEGAYVFITGWRKPEAAETTCSFVACGDGVPAA